MAFCTKMAGAGSAAVAPSDVFSTDTLKQHPLWTSMIAVDVTLKKLSVVGGSAATAAGVAMARLVRIGSPSRAMETLIGPTVPVDGTAILPLNVT